jgi:hypothetical protein
MMRVAVEGMWKGWDELDDASISTTKLISFFSQYCAYWKWDIKETESGAFCRQKMK